MIEPEAGPLQFPDCGQEAARKPRSRRRRRRIPEHSGAARSREEVRSLVRTVRRVPSQGCYSTTFFSFLQGERFFSEAGGVTRSGVGHHAMLLVRAVAMVVVRGNAPATSGNPPQYGHSGCCALTRSLGLLTFPTI